jgi:hypothetical protein
MLLAPFAFGGVERAKRSVIDAIDLVKGVPALEGFGRMCDLIHVSCL